MVGQPAGCLERDQAPADLQQQQPQPGAGLVVELLERTFVGTDQRGAANFLPAALRLCLMILLMNFLIRLTDSLSSQLVELLTFRSASNETGAGEQLGGRPPAAIGG